jgi:hypothetical protein
VSSDSSDIIKWDHIVIPDYRTWWEHGERTEWNYIPKRIFNDIHKEKRILEHLQKTCGKINTGTHKNMDHIKMIFMETDQTTGPEN